MVKAFDPRDPEQKLEEPTTWKDTENPVLISAFLAMELAGERIPDYWDQVAEIADFCEEQVPL